MVFVQMKNFLKEYNIEILIAFSILLIITYVSMELYTGCYPSQEEINRESNFLLLFGQG